MPMTFDEKVSYLASKGKTQENRKVVFWKDGKETVRSMNDAEWKDFVEGYNWDNIKDASLTNPEWIDVRKERIKGYPIIEDQIDAIFHGFKTLKSGGTDIGTEASKWVDDIQKIKDANKLPDKYTS